MYGIMFASSLSLMGLRISAIDGRLKLLFSSITGLLAALAVQLHDSPSSLVFFLQLFIYGTATGIIWMESFLKVNSDEMDRAFWVILFENVFKSIRYILVAYGALIVVLKFITSEMSGTYMDFLTTLIYPTMMIFFSIFAIGYWVLVPCWQHIVEAHRNIDGLLAKKRIFPVFGKKLSVKGHKV
jgi:hypothetical protein